MFFKSYVFKFKNILKSNFIREKDIIKTFNKFQVKNLNYYTKDKKHKITISTKINNSNNNVTSNDIFDINNLNQINEDDIIKLLDNIVFIKVDDLKIINTTLAYIFLMLFFKLILFRNFQF